MAGRVAVNFRGGEKAGRVYKLGTGPDKTKPIVPAGAAPVKSEKFPASFPKLKPKEHKLNPSF